MGKGTEPASVVEHYLKTLEKGKEQYQQYVEVSEVCELTVKGEEEPAQYQSPGPEHPLTTNRIIVG